MQARTCGIKAECLSHICQDDIHFNQFSDKNGEQVWVGSIADGCSDAFGSEHGSAFLARAFAEEAERLGKKGKRDIQFLRRVALALIKKMADYQPRSHKSEIVSYNGINVCKELYSTLYGFVADKDKILFLMAGDGFLAINSHGYNINQKGDLYPVYLLRFPKNIWQKKLENIFTFAEFPMERVNDLVLATDGFSHPNPNEYPGLTKEPAMFILQTHYSATKDDDDNIPGAYANRGGDDVTVLAFAQTGFSCHNPISADEVKDLCQQVRQNSNNFWDDKSMARGTMARKGISGNNPGFERSIPKSEGVYLFGISQKDIAEYGCRRNQINNSRIFDSNILATIFSKERASFLKSPKLQPVKTTKRAPFKPLGIAPLLKGSVSNQKPKAITPINKKARVPASVSSISITQQWKQQKRAAPSEKWILFQNLCDYRLSRRHSIGFRHFPFIANDLWKFIQNGHEGGWRFGNLRPQDLEFNVRKLGSKEPEFQFRMKNESVMAKVNKMDNSILDRPYGKLDEQFIHPRFDGKMATDDETRLDHDWYSYKILLFWVFVKADPFGLGTVKDKPEADRRYRMENKIYCISSAIELDEKKKLFIRRGFNRLGSFVKQLVIETNSQVDLYKKLAVMKKEFHEKLMKCDNIITKDGFSRPTICGFARLGIFVECPYCGQSKLRELPETTTNSVVVV